MDKFMDSLAGFLGKLFSAALVGGVILLIAGEMKLAALRKASQGSVRLSNFTERMTGMKLHLK